MINKRKEKWQDPLKFIDEGDVGILDYDRNFLGFYKILKQRCKDSIVNKVYHNGKLIHMKILDVLAKEKEVVLERSKGINEVANKECQKNSANNLDYNKHFETL